LDLQAAHDQVEAAASAVSLSKQQVEQARDRFVLGMMRRVMSMVRVMYVMDWRVMSGRMPVRMGKGRRGQNQHEQAQSHQRQTCP